MSAHRIVSWIAGLSLGPLLFAADSLHAGSPASVIPPVAATTLPAGRITAEPVAGPLAPGTPPAPSPLAPLLPPTAARAAPAEPTGASAVDLSLRAAITRAALAVPTPPPPPRSSDVVDDSRPITESVFDKEDLTDHHPVDDHDPVDSDGPITGSVFDKEDLTDHHPVP